MKEKAEHTFAICAYKESPYLEACIKSLLCQTVKSKILMVTSTPNAYIEQLANKYEIPCYTNPGEGGITQDWNYAYSCADTKYVTIAHQDDIYLKKYTETALKLLSNSKKPLIFFSDYFEIRDGKSVTKNQLLSIKRLMLLPLRIKGAGNSRWLRRRILSFGSPICCPSVAFVRDNLPASVFKNGFRACEDWEAWEMISKIKGEFIYSKELLVGHRIHEDSETSAIIGDNKRSEEEFQMYCKFWPRWVARVLTKAYATGQKSNQLNA